MSTTPTWDSIIIMQNDATARGYFAQHSLPILMMLALIPLVGCSSLKPVEKFATKASTSTTIADLGNGFSEANTLRRISEPITGWSELNDTTNLRSRLNAIHTVVSAYFETIAKLAGANRNAFDEDLSGTIKAIGEFEIQGKSFLTSEEVTNAELIAKSISNVVLEYERRQKLESLLENGAPATICLLDDLVGITGDFRKVAQDTKTSIEKEIKEMDRDLLPGKILSVDRMKALEMLGQAEKLKNAADAYEKSLIAMRDGLREIHCSRENLVKPDLKRDITGILAVLTVSENHIKKMQE